jgi:hypothetical protein
MPDIIYVTGPYHGLRGEETADCDGKTDFQSSEGTVRYALRLRLQNDTAIYAPLASTPEQVKWALLEILRDL